MDALFSLPALSFLIIPTFSSYSTSLNLLFFYLTWSTLVLSHPPLKVEILGTLAVRVLFYVLPSTLFLFFDGVLPSAAAGLKAQGNVALPGNGEKGRWWRVALVSVANVLLELALQAGVEALFTEVLHIRSALKVTTTLPMPWGIAKDLVRGLLLREVRSVYLARSIQRVNGVVRSCNTTSIAMVFILQTHHCVAFIKRGIILFGLRTHWQRITTTRSPSSSPAFYRPTSQPSFSASICSLIIYTLRSSASKRPLRILVTPSCQVALSLEELRGGRTHIC